MSQQDRFDRILASLHDATLNDARWPATAGLIDDACGTKGNILAITHGHPQKDCEIFYFRICHRGRRHVSLERRYLDLYFPQDEQVSSIAQLPDSRLVHVPSLYTEQELKSSPAYNEALASGKFQNGLAVCLNGPDESNIIWTLADPTERSGWQSDQVEMIEHLFPHIRQFVRVRHALVGAEALGASLAELLDNTRIGVIHLNRRGQIVLANDRARAILRRGDGLSDRDGFLDAQEPADDAQFKRLLTRALPTLGGQAVSGSMTVGRSPELPRLVLHVNPVGAHQTAFGPRHVAATVLVIDPGSRPRIDANLVAATLGLTPLESQIAASLAEGNSVRDIAVMRSRDESSVRWHVRQIHRKLGISRNTDLVRLVLSTGAYTGRGAENFGVLSRKGRA